MRTHRVNTFTIRVFERRGLRDGIRPWKLRRRAFRVNRSIPPSLCLRARVILECESDNTRSNTKKSRLFSKKCNTPYDFSS